MPYLEETADVYMKAMFGEHAIHVPINLIVQKVDDDGRVGGVFQTQLGKPLLFGSKKEHQLILGECVIRPHLVAHTNAFVGHGIAGLYRSGWTDTDPWINGGILLNPGGRELKRDRY